MADFRDELRTAAQKEHYIRTYIPGLKHVPLSSQKYRNASRAIQLAIKEGRQPKNEHYRRIVNVAQFNAEEKAAKLPGPVGPPEWADEEDSEYAQEGEEIYGDMVMQISSNEIRRKATVTVSWESVGMPITEAWLVEYWQGDYNPDIPEENTITLIEVKSCHKI